MKFIVEADNPSEILDGLIAEMPFIHVDIMTGNRSGGDKIKWKLKD